MRFIIYGFLNCAGIYFLMLILIGSAFRNRRRFDGRKTVRAILLGFAGTCLVAFTVFGPLKSYFNQYMSIALLAFMMILVCVILFKCTVMEALFVYFVVKNLTDVIFMISKAIQVYIVIKVADVPLAVGFMIAYMISAVISLPLIYLFMKKLIRPCIDITEGMPFWKLLWMLPVFYYIIYKMGISPDYPRPEYIWSETVIILPIIWGMGITLSFIIIISALTDITRLTEDRERLRASRQQVKLQQEQYHRLRSSIEETARIRHDWRQQLVMLQGYAQKEDCKSISTYLEKYVKESQVLQQPSMCDNFAVDSIAQHYLSRAREQGIKVKASFGIPEGFPVKEEEMCVVLGNLLENAVEACMRQVAGPRFISADVKAVGSSSVALVIENTYSTDVMEKDGVYLSSKRSGEGIGISSVKSIVEKNEGVIKIEYGQGIFRVSIMMKI